MRRSIVCAAFAVFGAACLLVNACVSDSTTGPDSGPDATADTTVPDTGNGDAGGDACAKTCNNKCVAIDDPAYGCTATSCTPCGALPHVATSKCANGACAVGTCTPDYDDLDNDAGNGCETPNPLAFSPSSLAVWLKADKGVVTASDGGVTGWTNLAGDGGVVETVRAGAPAVDTTLWPALPGVSSMKFVQGDAFNIDLTVMMNAGFTTFVAATRYGDTANLVLGSPAYSSAGCCGGAGSAFQLGWFNNTQVGSEVYCNSIHTPATANTTSGYQPALMTMWFDGALNYFTFNGTTINNSGQCPHALLNLSAPSFLGGGAGGPFFRGLVGEVVVYSIKLTDPDRAAVQTYLKTKWKTP
jgi:hypothetical protein